MKRLLILGAAIAWPLLTAGSCATTQAPEPRIVTVEVAVPVSSPCVPAKLGPPPEYPDTKEALLAAPDAATRLQLLGAGWPLKLARLNELEPVVAGCPKAAVAP